VSDDNFISRWSRRKSESKVGTDVPGADRVPVQAETQSALPATQAGAPDEITQPEALPPIESLTPESDFTPFMKEGVDPAMKRDAFKKLIQDPRYNVMDGLDVYIDDYSKPDPLPEGWLEKMNQVKHLGIFKPPPEEARDEDPGAAVELQKPMEEQALVPPAEAPPADTSEAEILPPGVGESGTFGRGA